MEAVTRDVVLHGPIDDAQLHALAARGPLHTLDLRDTALFTRRPARLLPRLRAVENLRLWCPATRAAVDAVSGIAGLHSLELLRLCGPGTLGRIADAGMLQQLFVASDGLRASDLLAISRSPSLRRLAAMNTSVTAAAFAALASMAQLDWLSLEDAGIGDAVAATLPRETPLRGLFLANNPLTDTGLRAIVRASGLRELDLWQTRVSLDGLALLQALPELDYLSLGHADPEASYEADALFAQLARLPRLRRLELDGVALSPRQQQRYSERFELRHFTR